MYQPLEMWSQQQLQSKPKSRSGRKIYKEDNNNSRSYLACHPKVCKSRVMIAAVPGLSHRRLGLYSCIYVYLRLLLPGVELEFDGCLELF